MLQSAYAKSVEIRYMNVIESTHFFFIEHSVMDGLKRRKHDK